MTLNASTYVGVIFGITALATAGAFLLAVYKRAPNSRVSRIVIILVPLWMVVQALVAVGGFYQYTSTVPPRLFLTGVLPALVAIIVCSVFFRSDFLESLPLRFLTLIHVVRIPVELVLLWLSHSGDVPRVMTFEGWNFDILSGLLAPIVYFISFSGSQIRRGILIAYNIVGFLLLANIVSIAILSLPSPIQQLAFEQPNRGVLFFPYIWLPTLVVPVVLFSHMTSLWKLAANKIS